MTQVVSLVLETRRQSHPFDISPRETINNTAVAAQQLLCVFQNQSIVQTPATVITATIYVATEYLITQIPS